MKKDENIVEKTLANQNSYPWIQDEDHQIIRAVMQGYVNDYGLLVEKYQIPIFNLLLRMLHDRDESEELTQQVFVKAYEALPTFRFEFRFFSWLYRIAVNQALSHIKKQRKFVALENIKDVADEQKDQNPDKNLLLRLMINKMKDKYKTVILLKYFQQLSYQEVAFVLNIPEKKVRSRLYDARIQLKSLLEKNGYYHSN